MTAEQVLVVPTRLFHDLGLFQGLSRDVDRYLPNLLAPQNLSFIPRHDAEHDPSFKQIIPYVVVRWRDQVFHYTRGHGATEKRLRALRSVGVGGHINPCDHAPGESPYQPVEKGDWTFPALPSSKDSRGAADVQSPFSTGCYRLGMLREVEEEIFLESNYRERCLGLINDDATPVGQVHLGIVHVFDLEEPKVRRREAELIHSGFAPLAQLLAAQEEFETWSQFVLQELVR